MTDRIETIQGATIQHGPVNSRIYLMKMGMAEPAKLIPALSELAARNSYTKIFAKVPAPHAEPFLQAGYRQEAAIPGFYHGTGDMLMLCSYPDPARQRESDPQALDSILAASRERHNAGPAKSLHANAILRECTIRDTEEMATIYQTVFPSYPFPIGDPAYLADTMQSHVVYFGIETEGRLVALSSAEMDADAQNVEMTDFATLPAWSGHGFATHLLAAMEPAMRTRNIKTAYTIARAASPGINITFARLGYGFGGRLANNTQISGKIESMNVWHKLL